LKSFFILLSTLLVVNPSGCRKEGRVTTMSNDKREPVVAGQFYPADSSSLKAMLQELFSQAKSQPPSERIVGIVAPHAGYAYSGATAAKAYKNLEGKHYDTVILIGPSHHVRFDGISVYRSGVWGTPLGSVPVDEAFANDLIDADELIDYFPQAHTQEHSLEVQIPFLQTVLSNFKIVPIVIGHQIPEICERLAEAIVSLSHDRKILLIASTDLYHGYSYKECYSSDSLVLETVGKFDIEGFRDLYVSKENVGCGAGPTYSVMLASKALGARNSILLEHTTSGDVTGNKSGYIVGYASFIFTDPDNPGKPPDNTEILSEKEKTFLLEVARKSIEAAVNKTSLPAFTPPTERLNEPRGVFVTLTKSGMLRGCIGYIQAIKPLVQSVSEMAISAALNDPRFPPVSPKEIDKLRIEISVLTPLKKIDDPEEVQVGRDGIFIKRGTFSGLLLPQVATEQGWEKTTFLEQTCYKAGLPSSAYKEADTDIFIFQALIFNEDELK
jgi:AmmeMemoRadiSam system protein B/AmmeMemoRadiSam system protein A